MEQFSVQFYISLNDKYVIYVTKNVCFIHELSFILISEKDFYIQV